MARTEGASLAMDLYRLLALGQSRQGCDGGSHIKALLDCAYPSIKLQIEEYYQREGKMFFSRGELNQHFRPHVRKLLECPCLDCDPARNEDSDKLFLADIETRLKRHPWILGLLIYLGKLHYIYYWMKWGFIDSDGELQVRLVDDERLERLIKPQEERMIFLKAYERAVSMFSPVVFKIQDDETCPYRDLADSHRLPYLREESISTQGFYGVMAKVGIHPDYLHETMKDRMRRYPSSGTDAGSDRKLLFAVKSVKPAHDSPLKSMERNVLDMVSRIEEPASNNIISLLFAYKWKGRMHFLFPFIEMNLDHLLRQGKCPNGRSSKLSQDEQLPEHWLWGQMKGVCRALKIFHSEMKNPFQDEKGHVIGLHFDLKPANILVTVEGVLKITDFGQSIIQIVGEGDDTAMPYNPGDTRYAAPESRPTPEQMENCLRNGPEDIQVLLNYDVWSLGCIMVEVLIHMLEQESLEDFDQRLNEEQRAGFATETGLKECVNSSLDSFQQMFSNSSQREYMVAVTELLRKMLSHDNKARPYSWEVFEALEKAENRLRELPPQVNKISQKVKGYILKDGIGFRELGWRSGHSIVSFADKSGITLELVQQRDEHRQDPRPCRIRIFLKSSKAKQMPVEIALVWGVEKGGTEDVEQKKFDISKWCFAPTYLFRDENERDGGFECRLFHIMGAPGKGRSYGTTFIFKFESLDDVLMFQGAILQKKIYPPFSASVQDMVAKRAGLRKKIYKLPEFTTDPSHIQLWADSEPEYYRATRSSVIGGIPRTLSSSASSAQSKIGGDLEEGQCDTMAIFFPYVSPLFITLDKGHQLFRNSDSPSDNPGTECVEIVYRKALGHESFSVRQLPAQRAWPSLDLSNAPHASSSILLESDYEKIPPKINEDLFKLESMKIILASKDYGRFYKGTIREWHP